MEAITRAAELNQVMAVIEARPPRPKPTKAGRKRVIKDKPKTISKAEETKKLDRAIDKLCRLITHWRDGNQCVLRDIDGIHCDDVIQWSHVIAQGASFYLQQNLGNAMDTCGSHNLMHRFAPDLYHFWYVQTFGLATFEALTIARITHNKKSNWKGFTIDELRTRRILYEELYDNRNYMNGANMPQLVAKGYYGEIVYAVWQKEGKLEKS